MQAEQPAQREKGRQPGGWARVGTDRWDPGPTRGMSWRQPAGLRELVACCELHPSHVSVFVSLGPRYSMFSSSSEKLNLLPGFG